MQKQADPAVAIQAQIAELEKERLLHRATVERIAEETRKAKADLEKARADYDKGKKEMEAQGNKVQEIVTEMKDSNVDFKSELVEHV